MATQGPFRPKMYDRRPTHNTSVLVLALQEVRGRYNGLFGDHVAAMVPFMWQHDTHAVAQLIKDPSTS